MRNVFFDLVIGFNENKKETTAVERMNEWVKQTCVQTWSRHTRKPALRMRHGGRWDERREKIGHRERGRERVDGGEEISLPACSAESSQQVRAWSLATAAVGSSRSSWLEALLCSFCCGMFSTYYTQLTYSHRRFMQINVRPRDICLLTDSGLSFLSLLCAVVQEARGFNLSL